MAGLVNNTQAPVRLRSARRSRGTSIRHKQQPSLAPVTRISRCRIRQTCKTAAHIRLSSSSIPRADRSSPGALTTSFRVGISAVGSNAFVINTGVTVTNTNGFFAHCVASVSLTNSTTVTANQGTIAVELTLGYMVVDLQSSLVIAVQGITHTWASQTDTSETDTIGGVTSGNSLLIYGGCTSDGSTPCNAILTRLDLTNSTTVTLTRSLEGLGFSATVTVSYTVVEFATAALNGSIQRGDVALSSSTSGTATISNVNTAKSFANYASQSGNGTMDDNGSTNFMSLALTNGTTVTANTNSAGSPTISYEVIQFA
jgi:hypothetical protein